MASVKLRSERNLNAVKVNRLLKTHGTESIEPVNGKIRYHKPDKAKLLIHSGDWHNYWAEHDARQFEALDDLPNFLAEAKKRESNARTPRPKRK